MIIALGSANSIKLKAVREALAALGLVAEVVGVEVPSGVNAQPIGDETTLGARNRAIAAFQLCPQATLAIGIENGLFLEDGAWHDAAVVVVLDRNSWATEKRGAGVTVPADCVAEVRNRGFVTTTIGTIIAERFGGDTHDPQATLTDGKIDRKTLLTLTLKELLLKSL